MAEEIEADGEVDRDVAPHRLKSQADGGELFDADVVQAGVDGSRDRINADFDFVDFFDMNVVKTEVKRAAERDGRQIRDFNFKWPTERTDNFDVIHHPSSVPMCS